MRSNLQIPHNNWTPTRCWCAQASGSKTSTALAAAKSAGITKAPDGAISLRIAHRDLWSQVAHVDPSVPNPTVGEFTRREARRHRDQKRMFE
jgi:hypothetical protein